MRTISLSFYKLLRYVSNLDMKMRHSKIPTRKKNLVDFCSFYAFITSNIRVLIYVMPVLILILILYTELSIERNNLHSFKFKPYLFIYSSSKRNNLLCN